METKLPPAGLTVELMDESGHVVTGMHCGLIWITPAGGTGNAISYWRLRTAKLV